MRKEEIAGGEGSGIVLRGWVLFVFVWGFIFAVICGVRVRGFCAREASAKVVGMRVMDRFAIGVISFWFRGLYGVGCFRSTVYVFSFCLALAGFCHVVFFGIFGGEWPCVVTFALVVRFFSFRGYSFDRGWLVLLCLCSDHCDNLYEHFVSIHYKNIKKLKQ